MAVAIWLIAVPRDRVS